MAEEQTNNSVSESHPDQPEPQIEKSAPTSSRMERFKAWYIERKKWTIPATILLVLLILAATPFTRYNIAGLILKRNLSVKVVDSTANTPVSGAMVSVGSISAETNSAGVATLRHVKVGSHKVLLSKKYYQDKTVSLLTPIFNQKTTPALQLTATGRQVKISITNLISKQPLANVDIKVADTTAKTDQTGSALVVLPANADQQKATLSLDGYNDASVMVKVSSDKIENDAFNLTPAGKVYFLSKLSGKIDVVKTNLDGTDRQTVLAGTGDEDNNNTVLLASRDWKYLALLSRRAGSSPTLYLIDTSNDATSTIESGSEDFNLVGWANDNFVYTVTNLDVNVWQANRQTLKSYNALTRKSVTLDQTAAGPNSSDQYNYLTESFGGVYAYDDKVYYIKNWNGSGASLNDMASEQATFNSIKAEGGAKTTIKSFALAAGASSGSIFVSEQVENPDRVDFYFNDGAKDNFYTYADGQVKTNINFTPNTFYSSSYPTFLLSPAGDKTFWSEPRDGKNTLFVGDEDGQNGQQIATLSDYNTYGWYTDNYLLVSKNSSELYIMDNKAKQTPVKISDYNKPAVTFSGYGGGYGGL